MNSPSPKIISLVCPVFDEEAAVPIFIDAVIPHLEKSIDMLAPGSSYEIVFIDDGSRDKTADIIADICKNNSSIKLVRFSRNFGKEAAIAAGLQYASGDAVIPIDIDLQDPPEIIPQLVEAWIKGAKVVNAKRIDRSSDSWIKKNTASLFYGIYNRVSYHTIPSQVGDFRLLDREVVDTLNEFTERNRFMKAIFSWVGYEQATVEYTRQNRAAGQTKFKYWKLWNFALDGLTGSTTVPLRMWTYIGLILAACSFLYAAFIIVRTLIFGNDVPGYSSLMVVILTIGSFNFISLGILGEYVGRISEEVRNRPLYIVQQTFGVDKKPAKKS